MTTVSIIGLGYMGLPMAAIVANAGHTVVGVDVQEKVVNTVNAGQVHFEEPSLASLVGKAVQSGKLTAHTKVQQADVHVIAVPTPFMETSKQPDMIYVEEVATALADVLRAGDLVVLESTSPVGATEKHVKKVIEQAKPVLKDKVLYAFCPERAIPGDTIRELTENDRLVGGLTDEATQKAEDFYRSFVTGKILPTHTKTAEMVKLVENTSRDVQIAFANELSLVCQELNLNVWDVIELANRHPRVNILQPGAGVGGHCIAVDPWFIIASTPKNTPLMQAARQVNDGKPDWVVNQVQEALKAHPTATVGVLGLAFKPNVDDLRQSPALGIAQKLQKQNVPLLVCEPNLHEQAEFQLYSLVEVLDQADILLILVAHDAFKTITEKDLAGKTVIDPCGLLRGYSKGSPA